MITGTIPDPIRRRESHHRQCRSRPNCRDVFDHHPTRAIKAGKIIHRYIEFEPTEDQSGFTRYAQFTCSDATDGSSNRIYLLQISTGVYTLWMMIGVYRGGYRSLTRLYTVSDYAMIQL